MNGKKIIPCLFAAFALALSAVWADPQELPLGNVRHLSETNTTLESGYIYRVPEGKTLRITHGLSVNSGASAAIYIPSNSTLDVTTDKVSQPGISLPPSSTLVVFGAGKLKAKGGRGTNGGKGAPGKSARKAEFKYLKFDQMYSGGEGGKGGYGGQGAGAGIGGVGGVGGQEGGEGGACPMYWWWHNEEYDSHDGSVRIFHDDRPGGRGGTGESGQSGTSMGILKVLGTVQVKAESGNPGDHGKRNRPEHLYSESHQYLDTRVFCWNYFGAGRTGGGGGGGGGAGGNLYQHGRNEDDNAYPWGGEGKTGEPAGDGDADRKSHQTDAGGEGGAGGAAGHLGHGGTMYYAFWGNIEGRTNNVDNINIQTNVCEELTYRVELDPDYPGGTTLYGHFSLSNSWVSLPDPIKPPTRTSNYRFDGYWSKKGGLGVQYVDKDGKWLIPIPLDQKMLYAKWIANRVRVRAGLGGPDAYADLDTSVVWHAPMPKLPQSLMDIAASRTDMHFAGAFDEPQASLVSESRGNQYYKRNGTSARNWSDMSFDDAAYSVGNPPTLYMHWVSERARVDILSVTTRAPWSGEVDIRYTGVDIPVANGRAYRLDLQYRLSSTNVWTAVPPEHYRRLSDWTEHYVIDGVTQLVHRVTNGIDRLTWDARQTLGSALNRRDAQVRINACDIGARWDGYYPDKPQAGVWPANLMSLDFGSSGGILTQPSDPAHPGSPLAPVDLAQLAGLATSDGELFRTQRILFRQIPAGYFKDGDRYWHFSGTTYASVFRLTKGQLAQMNGVTTSEKDDPTVASVSLSTLRGSDCDPMEPPAGKLGELNGKIGEGWKIDVMPDYQYGRRLLWAGRGVCPVTNAVSAAEYGDFSGSYAVGGKKPSDWGFFDLISGYELTLSTTNNLDFAKFGASGAASAPTDVGSDVRFACTEDEAFAVRLFLTPTENNTLVVEEVSEEELKPRGARIYGDPAWVWLDTRIEREILAPTWLPYSGTHWGEVEGGAAYLGALHEPDMRAEDIAVPGTGGYDGTGAGDVLWRPLSAGRYMLWHNVGDKQDWCVFTVPKGAVDVGMAPLPQPWSEYVKTDIGLEGLTTNADYTLAFEYRKPDGSWTEVSPGSFQWLPPVVTNSRFSAAWRASCELGADFAGDVEVRSILRVRPIADSSERAQPFYPEDAVCLNLVNGTNRFEILENLASLWGDNVDDHLLTPTNMVFVKLPAGSYFAHDGFLRVVDSDYYVAAAPLSRKQFSAVCGYDPFMGLSLEQAKMFVQRMNEKFADLGYAFTIPTEDEWERAVSAGLVYMHTDSHPQLPDASPWEWCTAFGGESPDSYVLRRSVTERIDGDPVRHEMDWSIRPVLRVIQPTRHYEYWTVTGEVVRVSLDFTNRLSIANGETVALPLDGWGLAPTATRTELTVSGGSAELFRTVVTNFDASVTGQVVRVTENGPYDLMARFDDGLTLTGEVSVRIPTAVVSNVVDRTPWSTVKEFDYRVEGVGGGCTVSPVLSWSEQDGANADWRQIDGGSLLSGVGVISSNGTYAVKFDPLELGLVPANVVTSLVFRVDLVDSADPSAVYRGRPHWCEIDTLEVHEGSSPVGVPYSFTEWGDRPDGWETAALVIRSEDVEPVESIVLTAAETNAEGHVVWEPGYNGLYELTLNLGDSGTMGGPIYRTKYRISGFADYLIESAEYASLADAVDAAGAGQTINLARDLPGYVGNTDIPAGKDVVLDFTPHQFNGRLTAHGKVRIGGGFFGGALVTDRALTNEIVRGYFASYPTNWFPVVGSYLLLNQDPETMKDYPWRVYDAVELEEQGWTGAVGFGDDPDVRLDYRPAATTAELERLLGEKGAGGVQFFADVTAGFAVPDANPASPGVDAPLVVLLNGHDILGRDGSSPGADGGVALTVGKGWDVTVLNLRSESDARIVGGSGAAGADGRFDEVTRQAATSGGKGAVAIDADSRLAVQTEATGACRAIEVRGGDGGNGGNTLYGNGGNGGDGACSIYGYGGDGGNGGNCYDPSSGGKGGDGGDGGAALLPGCNGLPGVAGSPNGRPGDDPCAEFHWAARVDGVDKKTFAAALDALCDGSLMTFYRDFRGALTLEPDLGTVTFDLNGRSILGVDGTDARDPAKADGHPALVVNMNTWLVLTNGAFDASQPASESNRLSYVKGGDGAAGIIGIEAVPYGKGARAVMPEPAVVDGRIHWDATSVVVTNGVDGAASDSLIALLRKRLQPEGTAELRDGFAYAYLTNDLVRTVEVPPKMGPVTFDLQGHVMTGAAGEPALKVREGTQLTVVDSDPDRRGNVVAGAGAPCPYELWSTNGLSTTQLPYAASSLDGAGVTRAAYDGKAHTLRFVTAADETVTFTGANAFVNAGANRAAFAYRREGFEPLVAFATLEIAPWRFNTVEFVGTAVDDQPWSETPFCPVPTISNLTLRTTLTVSNDFTCVLRADGNGLAYVLATGCGNYCGTLACALVKKDPSDIGDLYRGNVPVVVTGYSGTADGKGHAVTYRWTSSDVYNNTILFSMDGKSWSPTPPTFVTTYGRKVRVYYYAQSQYASKHTKAYTSTRWYVTVRISEIPPDDPDDPDDPAPTPAFGPSADGRLFTDNGDGTVGVTIGNAKAGVTYAVTAAKDLTFDGATTTEATAAKDGPLTVNVPRPSDEAGFFKASVRP